MKDMCGNELKVGDLVIFAQKTAIRVGFGRGEGIMSFGVISKFYKNYYGHPTCSVTLADGRKVTNVLEDRIMKVENIANQYDQVKDTGDFQSFLDAMEGKE